MTVKTFEERLQRAEEVLTRVANGDFDVRIESSAFVEDALGSLEMGINFLIVDLRSIDEANREKADALAVQQRELEEKLVTIAEQAASIRKLSTPVVEVWDDILALPLVGTIDTQRSEEIMAALLDRIVAAQARGVIVDVTGVDFVDTQTADYLLKIGRSVALLGAHYVLTGVSPAVAQTLVAIGADLSEVRTFRTLKDGIQECLRHLSGATIRRRKS